MHLLPQDVVVVLKLVAKRNNGWTYAALGKELMVSPSQVFRSVRRAENAHLLSMPPIPTMEPPPGTPLDAHNVYFWPNKRNLQEFLIHGLKYSFPAERGGPTRGVPTAEGAAPLNKHFAKDFELPPVWPHVAGAVRGLSFAPLAKNVPEASVRDAKLYELLALVDAIREGRAREREIAIRELSSRLE